MKNYVGEISGKKSRNHRRFKIYEKYELCVPLLCHFTPATLIEKPFYAKSDETFGDKPLL